MDINQLVKQAKFRRLPPTDERRRIRESAGVTQAELGVALGVSSAAIARWENGSRRPGRRVAQSYAEALRRLERAIDL
jgi:transcriptional regulator with XRE-family HTH domain